MFDDHKLGSRPSPLIDRTFHSALSSGLPITLAAIAAPCMGGFEYMGRTTSFSCDSTRVATSLVSDTTLSAPARSPYSPMFLANDCASTSSKPADSNSRTAAASASRSPLAKPYGAVAGPQAGRQGETRVGMTAARYNGRGGIKERTKEEHRQVSCVEQSNEQTNTPSGKRFTRCLRLSGEDGAAEGNSQESQGGVTP